MGTYHIKSGYTNDFIRGIGKSKLTFKSPLEAKRYIRNNAIEERKFKVIKFKGAKKF